MDCIYLNCQQRIGCHCHAQPVRDREPVVFYKPTDEEIKGLCKDPKKWSDCPRYIAFEDYRRATGTPKKE